MTHPWWHRAAVYQVYPRSFRDTNGDGTGDLQGIITELPYIAALGVNAIWLSPFYRSPQHDSGYDVADPRSVDPMYGTLDDARELIDQAHARGLKVLVDVVPNHTSADRDWFQQALAAAPGSPERARYHFLDGRGPEGAEPPTNWQSVFGGIAWTRITEPDGTPGQWYLHLFDSSQPDLNWANREVRDDALETLRYWMDMGADGFRVDVALAMAKDMTYPDIDDPVGFIQSMRLDIPKTPEFAQQRARVPNSPVLDRDELVEIYREWRELMDSYPGDRMAVAEAWVLPDRVANYVGGETLHQIFNFDFLSVAWDAETIAGVVDETLAGLAGVQAPPTWALSNHDTPRVPSRLGGGEEGRRRARALALVAHALPGAVYVYQGEELALEDGDLPDAARQDPVWFRTNGEQKGRDGCRVPLPWSGDAPPYGFGASVPESLWLPQPRDWAERTVNAQQDDPQSALWQYRAMLRLRHAHPGLASPELALDVADGVLTIVRGAGFRCVVNTGPSSHSTTGRILVASDPSVTVEGDSVTLPPSTGCWLQC